MWKQSKNDDPIKFIIAYKKYLTPQQFNTLLGQVLKGEVYAARKGLVKLLRRQGREVRLGRNNN